MSGVAVAVQACEPWCEIGEARHAEDHPVDRRCVKWGEGLSLSLHDARRMDSGEFMQDKLEVHLSRPPGTSTEVWLFHEGDDTDIRMTVDEAKGLMDALHAALAVAH